MIVFIRQVYNKMLEKITKFLKNTKSLESQNLKLSVQDDVKMGNGLQIGHFGKTYDGKQKIGARRNDWRSNQDIDEIVVVKRFCLAIDNRLDKFEKILPETDIDVRAISFDGSFMEEFQVTSFHGNNFWKSLSDAGVSGITLSQSDLNNLVLDRLRKKGSLYSPERKKQIILLIDTSPVSILPEFVGGIRESLAQELNRVGFKKVALVGFNTDYVYEL